jgi:hypothetical protein
MLVVPFAHDQLYAGRQPRRGREPAPAVYERRVARELDLLLTDPTYRARAACGGDRGV